MVGRTLTFDGDEDGIEESSSQVPEHVQKRKEILDLAKKIADERAALKLPPLYEDVDFSDDDRLVWSSYFPFFYILCFSNIVY